MKRVTFDYKDTCLLGEDTLKQIGQNLVPEIERIANAVDQNYLSEYASINLPADVQLVQTVQNVIQEKKALQPTMLIVIGIGGSNLGTIAVHEALYGKFYNEQRPDIKLYFADTVDSDYILDILLLVEQELEKQHNVIINVVSKSGTTTETIANFELFLQLLKQTHKTDYQNYIVVTTDKGSKLWDLAQDEGFACLEVPKNVGGRYSVFSAVGLFPLGFIGVDIEQLLAGARSIIPPCANIILEKNPAALSAALLYAHYQDITIHDMFLFSVDLESIGKWYRQLMGESIGKEFNRTAKRVMVGITPTVSIGSTDLHSVAQLYLGGPRDKFTTFVLVEKNKSNLELPRFDEFEKLVAKIQGKSLSSIMNAILQGIQTAYSKNNRPFASIIMPEKSAWYVGQLLQWKMIEMMYLGYLLDVNPFDQPNVEAYKKETREILAHE